MKKSVFTYDGMVIHAVFSTPVAQHPSNPIDDTQFEEWMDDPDHSNELMLPMNCTQVLKIDVAILKYISKHCYIYTTSTKMHASNFYIPTDKWTIFF